MLDCPDCLAAFDAYLKGNRDVARIHGLVDNSARLFVSALRVAGWNHMVSGGLKYALKSYPLWPERLSAMRLLCKFYRNEAYRAHIVRCVKLRTGVDVSKLMQYFSASFARWRFETVWTVQDQLLPLRQISEREVQRPMFNNPQDRETVEGAIDACSNKDLWVFMAVSQRLLVEPNEERCGL